MGFIRIRPIRPAPLWCGVCCPSGVDDPVRSHRPFSPGSSSTLWRTSSQISGTSCHSSMTWGRSPININDGSARATSRLLPRSTYVMLDACARADHVLPHHLVPAISTAPKMRIYLSICASTIRERYPVGMMPPDRRRSTSSLNISESAKFQPSCCQPRQCHAHQPPKSEFFNFQNPNLTTTIIRILQLPKSE